VLAALGADARVGLPELLVAISLGGLLRLFHDPRMAIACSLVWIALLSPHAARPGPAGLGVFVILAAVTAGLLLTLAGARLWIMRRSATG
jgi:hypothetical protein